MHLSGYRKLWTSGLLITVTLATAVFSVACGTLEETGFIAYDSGTEGKRDIGVIRPDGTSGRAVITHPSDDFSPVWSPDRKRMAFLSNRDGNVELYVASADGSDVMRLTNTKVAESSPTAELLTIIFLLKLFDMYFRIVICELCHSSTVNT